MVSFGQNSTPSMFQLKKSKKRFEDTMNCLMGAAAGVS